MPNLYKTFISGQNMHLIVIYALTFQVCICMHYKSSPTEPLSCDSFAPNFQTDIQNRPNMHYMQNSRLYLSDKKINKFFHDLNRINAIF
jgi:hypothetical protein